MAPARASAAKITGDTVTNVSSNTHRKNAACVGLFRRQGRRTTNCGGHPCLRDAFCSAACPKVAPGRPRLGHPVVYDSPRLEDELAVRYELPGPDTQLSFLAAKRVVCPAAQPVVEPTNGLKDRAAQGHVAAHQVAHRRGRDRLPAIAAANDPTELGWPPARRRLFPHGMGGATNPENAWIVVGGEHVG